MLGKDCVVRGFSFGEKRLLTLRKTESRAAEYLNPFSNRSYSFSLFVRRLSTLNSSTSPNGFDLTLLLSVPCPRAGSVFPRKDSKVPLRRAEAENSDAAFSEDLGCLRRTDNVPSDMPAAM